MIDLNKVDAATYTSFMGSKTEIQQKTREWLDTGISPDEVRASFAVSKLILSNLGLPTIVDDMTQLVIEWVEEEIKNSAKD